MPQVNSRTKPERTSELLRILIKECYPREGLMRYGGFETKELTMQNLIASLDNRMI
jgi:hypothetical protein